MCGKFYPFYFIFFSPISLQSKNRKSHFLSPFPFSVFPHFSSQPNGVKIEWNSNKESEEMGTQREKKFDDNYKENNQNKVGFVCGGTGKVAPRDKE